MNKKLLIFGILSAAIPFIFYTLTLERKLVGGDTSWYMSGLPQMSLLPPTGYPIFSIIGKLFSVIPIGPLALRLNLISAVFGSLTVLFLFLAIYTLSKNEFAALIASFSFAFTYPFWSYANRLEFDTLNSFFIALLLFAIFRYRQIPSRKNLYFCFACLGFLLTNHPIAFFIMPAFLILTIILNPRIFKKIKVVFLSIFFFILPLLSYIYTYVIFSHTYGDSSSLRKFIYYLTGRESSGATFGGSFGDKMFNEIIRVILDYLIMIYNNYGIILILIAFAGLLYLFRKNWKIAAFSLLAIIFNLIITTQYLNWAVLNYTLDIMLIMSVYIGFGILLFIDIINFLFERNIIKNSKNAVVKNRIKNSAVLILILLFASQPVMLIINNYKKCDSRIPKGIYVFWNDAFTLMERDSKLYAYTASVNIGIFISKFELQQKNIRLIRNNETEYNFDKIVEDVSKGTSVYFVGNDEAISQVFVTEKIGGPFFWERYNENLQLYEITKATPKVMIEGNFKSQIFEYGKEIIMEYIITNNSNDELKINSFELDLPKGLKFDGMFDESEIKDGPGISLGKYMWVSDDYFIPVNSKISFIFKITPEELGNFKVNLRLTTGGVFFSAKEMSFKIN
ncbi:MAG: protein O-mannosyl-transferase family [Candidatus Humimicrobiaceae bacterium]